ncbi:hypothetical protein SAMN02745704_00308 [Paucidesulfovibrio gracilis DSM 16080]|uniref:Uncharacterized protein n=1 Tax=Paucidesulfovibrio gracilis DSM 16080 TaxID=1121449 RepID=A0A1T4W4J7_9BACT|nr:hypothetical protein [Paucidesulfovibrio gracilis]SKA72176.1 hypothetical protein SAMN02745704_00308 [Paucidesulfovibrio gracilis DSM 16080]
MTESTFNEINEFVTQWNDNGNRCKDCFLRLKQHCEGMDGIRLEWIARPGITYSLRATHSQQADSDRNLFAMIDIIDDDPSDRWLSVCFYNDMVSDPDEAGDYVPEGLLGQDALCFDVESWDDGHLGYVESRLSEACSCAAGGSDE